MNSPKITLGKDEIEFLRKSELEVAKNAQAYQSFHPTLRHNAIKALREALASDPEANPEAVGELALLTDKEQADLVFERIVRHRMSARLRQVPTLRAVLERYREALKKLEREFLEELAKVSAKFESNWKVKVYAESPVAGRLALVDDASANIENEQRRRSPEEYLACIEGFDFEAAMASGS